MSLRNIGRDRIVATLVPFLFGASALLAAESGNSYHRRNLVSDGGVPAEQPADPELVNGWGLAASSSGPWWVNAADSGHSLIYDAVGVKGAPLASVSVPGSPTGIVFNGGAGFVIPGFGAAKFLFATEEGTIAAWNSSLIPITDAIQVIDSTPDLPSYKGLAIDSTTAGARLYAADFHNQRVDVFDANFAPIVDASAFVDPNLPKGYSPFGIQTLAGNVYVAYALKDPDEDEEIAGPGLGVVDKYDLDGRFIARVATGGALNAPWGLALAPAGFGRFSGRLLIGNFGNGRINAYSATTFAAKGHLKYPNARPIVIDGLWGIAFGNGGSAGPQTTLYFAAGPNDESNGLFGRIDPP